MATIKLGAGGEYAARELDGLFEGEAENRILPAGDSVLLRADAERVTVALVNLGTRSIFIHFGFRGKRYAGLEITGYGGSLSLDYREDVTLPAQEILAQVNAPNHPIYITWQRRYREYGIG